MSQKQSVALKRQIFPLNQIMLRFMKDSQQQIEKNFVIQKIFPTEVYPGYKRINAKKPATDPWKSTGEGVKSLSARLAQCDNNGNITMIFSYNAYMDYVDMGVGKLRGKADDIDRAKNATIRSRYITNWDMKTGFTHRPVLYKELGPHGHLVERMQNYIWDHFARVAEVKVLEYFEDLDGVPAI